jgi:transposase-like protein
MSDAVQPAEAFPEPRSTRTGADISPRTSAPPQRIEIISGPERRRRWSAEQKREIVAESHSPASSALATARRHGISSGQLYMWRRELRRAELGDAGGLPARFVRVDAPTSGAHRSPGLIEIALACGATLRVDAQVDGAALRRVIEALAG